MYKRLTMTMLIFEGKYQHLEVSNSRPSSFKERRRPLTPGFELLPRDHESPFTSTLQILFNALRS